MLPRLPDRAIELASQHVLLLLEHLARESRVRSHEIDDELAAIEHEIYRELEAVGITQFSFVYDPVLGLAPKLNVDGEWLEMPLNKTAKAMVDAKRALRKRCCGPIFLPPAAGIH